VTTHFRTLLYLKALESYQKREKNDLGKIRPVYKEKLNMYRIDFRSHSYGL
jgi:hypothetical protein